MHSLSEKYLICISLSFFLFFSQSKTNMENTVEDIIMADVDSNDVSRCLKLWYKVPNTLFNLVI